MQIWRMRIARWISKATNANLECVITVIAFPLQQWLHERASMLRYTYIACLVLIPYNTYTAVLSCLKTIYMKFSGASPRYIFLSLVLTVVQNVASTFWKLSATVLRIEIWEILLYLVLWVLKQSRPQNSIKFSRANSRVKMWQFSDLSGVLHTL